MCSKKGENQEISFTYKGNENVIKDLFLDPFLQVGSDRLRSISQIRHFLKFQIFIGEGGFSLMRAMTKPARPENRTRTQHKGLPKHPVSRYARRNPFSTASRKSSKMGKSGKTPQNVRKVGIQQADRLIPCNSTNTSIIQSYFKTVHPDLYAHLAAGGEYHLYQYGGSSRDIYLVPLKMHHIVKRLLKTYPIYHSGIHLGYMRRKMTHTGFERAFYLSYEGGAFLYSYINASAPEMLSDTQSIILDEDGEKGFLYGRDVTFDDVISDTDQLKKKRIIFVLDEDKEYIGLALLMVSQAGVKKPNEEKPKKHDEYSRSPNFALRLMNLADAGLFLRKGA